jgi:hypothetical protein
VVIDLDPDQRPRSMQLPPTASLLPRAARAWPQRDTLADPSRTRAHDGVNHGDDQPFFGGDPVLGGRHFFAGNPR